MSLIQGKELAVGYEQSIVADHINFSVHKGDYLGIIGENGAGKSTLIKTLLSLQKPLKGEIVFGGGLQAHEIGYLPQRSTSLQEFPASVEEIVRSGFLNRCGIRPYYTKEEKQMAINMLQRVGMLQFKKRCFRELSGGQQQRVLIARALCATQKLLLLDEPVAGLDPEATLELYELIAQLKNEGTTIIMVSHDLDATMKYATHILHIAKQPLFFGDVLEYKMSDIGQIHLNKVGGGLHV